MSTNFLVPALPLDYADNKSTIDESCHLLVQGKAILLAQPALLIDELEQIQTLLDA